MNTQTDGISRSHYPWCLAISTRWMDNDIYGHINNVVYYSFFDTIANRYLIDEGGLDIHQAEVIAYVVQSHCAYRKPIAFPQKIDGALRVSSLGKSSVSYQLALFAEGEQEAAALGEFTHVFVNRKTGRPTPIEASMRRCLERIQM